MKGYNFKNTLLPFIVTTVLFSSIFLPLVHVYDNGNTIKNIQFIMFGVLMLLTLLIYIGVIWRPSRKMDKKYNVDSTWKIEAKRDYPNLKLTFQEFKRLRNSSDRTAFLVVLGITLGQVLPLVLTGTINL